MAADTVQSPIQPYRERWLAPVGLAGLVALAYGGSLRGPFVYDDIPSIVANPSIRHLWSLGDVLWPNLDGAVTVSGRPVLNLSFALSYAISGLQPWGHHALNVLIHLAATLVLFGLARRTLGLPALRARCGAHATLLAAAIAALWALHPLQTQAVTYTVQRAESLMGFFYLLTLYAFVRAASDSSRRWAVLAVAACALGMATKEVMVTAPLIVLLFDRTFVAGSFREVWRQRRTLHFALAATWLLLAALVLSLGGNRGGSIGPGVGVSWAAYVLTQFEAITHYLRLGLWPHPLVFEYGTFWVQRWTDVLPGALVVVVLLAGTGVALWKQPALGFAGAWCFGILAPTSLSPGTTQMIVEHRMYLPLAAVVATLVLVAHALLRARAVFVAALAVLACAAIVVARTRDYRSALALWSDTLAKRPVQNIRAHENLAAAFIEAGRVADGLRHYETAVQLAPGEAKSHYNLARALMQAGRAPEAVVHFEAAARLAPADANAHNNLAFALAAAGRLDAGLPHAELAARLAPDNAAFRSNYAVLLLRAGRAAAQSGDAATARAHYERAVATDPSAAAARYNLANSLLALGDVSGAITRYEEALRLQPDFVDAHVNLANALTRAGRPADALMQLEQAVGLAPADVGARIEFANALVQQGRTGDAIGQFEEALRLRPDLAAVREQLARLRAAPRTTP